MCELVDVVAAVVDVELVEDAAVLVEGMHVREGHGRAAEVHA